ncbi:MAG: Ig-like domain-containing protein [Candidatus Marinimicrobia bacterium]|nr:Ig-like domain-containing protein [Candidatus Neomarinimicrobiota bacterium]
MHLLILSCAAIQSPPGGPEDTTPPYLVTVSPANETIEFSGGEILLQFSEYMDENSLKKSLRVFPILRQPLDVKFRGEDILLRLPNTLSPNQTYVITVSRDLKDEHGVPLAEPIHLAYSTGTQIDHGQISGVVSGSENASVHLWKHSANTQPDSLYFTEPDYITNVTDAGTYLFQYLSPGSYHILAIGNEGAGRALDPTRMRYGMFWEKSVIVSEKDSVSHVNMLLHKDVSKQRLLRGEWLESNWGKLIFSNAVTETNLKPIGVIERESGENLDFSWFVNSLDSTQVILISDSLLTPGEKLRILINITDENQTKAADTSAVTVIVPEKPDTTWLDLLSPKQTLKLSPDKTETPSVSLVFSKPVEKSRSPFGLALTKEDSVAIAVIEEWVNSMCLNIYPVDGWEPNSTYQVTLTQDSTAMATRATFKDSLTTIVIKTTEPIGYGVLRGQTDIPWCKNCRVNLTSADNSTFTLSECVNSATVFEFNHVPEGTYFLMIYNDQDQNNSYTFGDAIQNVVSEQFWQIPDTVDIRANWDLELDLRPK